MHEQIDKSKENKSRAVVNSVTQNKNNQKQGFRFVDSRPESVVQMNLQYPVNTKPKVENAVQPQPVQRYAYVGDKYLNTSSDQKFYYNEDKDDRPDDSYKLNGKTNSVLYDKYYRMYNSFDEFKDHMENKPVSVGLAKPYGLWYTLPFGSFFVLGENHAGLNYRDVYRESNRTGKILGEGGMNSLSKDPDVLEKNENGSALPDEYKMENMASKAYYAYLTIWGNINQPPVAKSPKKQEGVDNFSKKYNQNGLSIGRSAGIPYYKEHGDTVYLSSGNASVYNKSSTGMNILKAFMSVYPSVLSSELGLITNYKAGDAVTDTMKNNHDTINKTLFELAMKVESAMVGSEHGLIESRIDQAKKIDVAENAEGYSDLRNAFGLRDHAMFLSIVKASKEGYEMAGIGDNHAQNLKKDLTKEGIVVITLNEFIKDKSTNALLDR